jgi:hypothetical protein
MDKYCEQNFCVLSVMYRLLVVLQYNNVVQLYALLCGLSLYFFGGACFLYGILYSISMKIDVMPILVLFSPDCCSFMPKRSTKPKRYGTGRLFDLTKIHEFVSRHRQEIFSLQNIQTHGGGGGRTRSSQPLIQLVAVVILMGVKRTGTETDHSPPYRAEVKFQWSYTSMTWTRQLQCM